MAKKKRGRKGKANPRVTFTTTPQIVKCLEELRRTGFYGSSRGRVAEDLVKQALKQLYVPQMIRPRALSRGGQA